jgi:hypothetical protein
VKATTKVQDALQNHAWVSDIQETLTTAIIVEYIELWDLLEEVQLQQEMDDTHIFGGWMQIASTQLDRLMTTFFWAPCNTPCI